MPSPKRAAPTRGRNREATEQPGKDVLKGTRWLLLKNPENLNEDKDEPIRGTFHGRLE